jgi:RES domain-containing protein
MNLSLCKRLTLRPINATWYRAIPMEHWRTALKTDHTAQVATRFNPGPAAKKPFEILYLAENQSVAFYEGGVLFGPPDQPIAHPAKSKTAPIDVDVRLQAVADLSDEIQRNLIEVSLQELTGTWRAYALGEAPTQRLGAALYATKGLEGFITISAQMPRCRNLVVFPQKLLKGSELAFVDPVQRKTHRIVPRLPST